MKKTLEKIRSKPPEVRMTIAFVLAIIFTVIIGAGWAMTLSKSNHPVVKSQAPSPLSALSGTIKDIVVNPHQNSTIQIIEQ